MSDFDEGYEFGRSQGHPADAKAIKELRTRAEQAEKQLAEVRGHEDKLALEFVKLEAELDSKEKQLAEVRIEFKHLKIAYNEMGNDHVALQGMYAKLKAELAAKDARIKELETYIRQAEAFYRA